MDKRTCSIEGCDKAGTRKGWCNQHYERNRKYGDPLAPHRRAGRPFRAPQERVWERVDKSGECWEWTGYKGAQGYGILRDNDHRVVQAHRMAYESVNGPIRKGLHIDHLCHNRLCCNPAHLRAVTPKQNNENHPGRARKDSKSGIRGVFYRDYQDLWVARVKSNGVVWSTYHKTKEAAAEAVREMRNQVHTHNDQDRISA